MADVRRQLDESSESRLSLRESQGSLPIVTRSDGGYSCIAHWCRIGSRTYGVRFTMVTGRGNPLFTAVAIGALLIAQFARLPHGHAGMNEAGKDNHASRPHVHLGHSHTHSHSLGHSHGHSHAHHHHKHHSKTQCKRCASASLVDPLASDGDHDQDAIYLNGDLLVTLPQTSTYKVQLVELPACVEHTLGPNVQPLSNYVCTHPPDVQSPCPIYRLKQAILC